METCRIPERRKLLQLAEGAYDLSKAKVVAKEKVNGKNAIRLSDLKKITSLAEEEGGSDEDKKLKDQLAVSDKAFKIHFTKTLSAVSAKAYCTMLGRRFFSTKYKEIKVDIYIF